uniref:Uncharacterized protein n=1 Tax=Strigamia maritima TaxID=126957 RepID=T1JHE9_STRMM
MAEKIRENSPRLDSRNAEKANAAATINAVTATPQTGSALPPPAPRKKTSSFQITSVTVVGSRLSNDGGDDSADDLDESHTEDISSEVLDISKMTDADNDYSSEDAFSSTMEPGTTSVQSLQLPVPNNGQGDASQIPISSTSSVSTDEGHHDRAIPWHTRFRVVKIESTEPFKRGRWICMDFLDPPPSLTDTAEREGGSVNIAPVHHGGSLPLPLSTQSVPQQQQHMNDFYSMPQTASTMPIAANQNDFQQQQHQIQQQQQHHQHQQQQQPDYGMMNEYASSMGHQHQHQQHQHQQHQHQPQMVIQQTTEFLPNIQTQMPVVQQLVQQTTPNVQQTGVEYMATQQQGTQMPTDYHMHQNVVHAMQQQSGGVAMTKGMVQVQGVAAMHSGDYLVNSTSNQPSNSSNQIPANRPSTISLTSSTKESSAVASESLASNTVTSTPPVLDNLTAASETEENENTSGSSTVAIDNKIEQAMDLVKSHLMFAVREEVDVLKEKITELMDRINQLEYENSILRAAASQETLAKLAQPPPNPQPPNPSSQKLDFA